jgi:hypothetical protein
MEALAKQGFNRVRNVECGKKKAEVRNQIIWIYNRWISANCSL